MQAYSFQAYVTFYRPHIYVYRCGEAKQFHPKQTEINDGQEKAHNINLLAPEFYI
jgi:hypothetical protein